MSMDLAKKTYTCTPDRLIAGATIPITTETKVASEALKAKAPVALNADGKLEKIKTSNINKIYGIVSEDTAADAEGVVYLTGEYFADELVLETGVTVEAIEVALRNIGIFLK